MGPRGVLACKCPLFWVCRFVVFCLFFDGARLGFLAGLLLWRAGQGGAAVVCSSVGGCGGFARTWRAALCGACRAMGAPWRPVWPAWFRRRGRDAAGNGLRCLLFLQFRAVLGVPWSGPSLWSGTRPARPPACAHGFYFAALLFFRVFGRRVVRLFSGFIVLESAVGARVRSSGLRRLCWPACLQGLGLRV